jgi:hypothetical protein
VIERGDPKPIPESTDWGLLPMLLDRPPGPAGVGPGVVIGMVFPFPVPAMGPEPEIRRWGSKQKKVGLSWFLVVFDDEITKILRNSLFIFHFVLPILPCKRKTS